METSSILLMLASCFAIAFGLLGLSCLFERGLDRWRSQRAVDRTGGRGLIGRILAEGITPLAGLSKAVLRITFFGLFVEGVVREVRRLDYRTDLVPMGTVLLASSGLVFSLAYAFSFSVIGGLASVVCAFLMVNAWVNKRNDQRKEEVREEIPEAMQSMKACFQTGYSLSQTVHEVAEHTKGPLSELFSEVEGNLETGSGVHRALAVMRAEHSEPELAFLATSLEIQHKTGGSMQRILEAARQSVCDELELKRNLRTQTAQAKLSAQIVTAMPFALVGVFSLLSPGFLDPFFESPLGVVMLMSAIGMQVLGVSIVRRLLRVEVA